MLLFLIMGLVMPLGTGLISPPTLIGDLAKTDKTLTPAQALAVQQCEQEELQLQVFLPVFTSTSTPPCHTTCIHSLQISSPLPSSFVGSPLSSKYPPSPFHSTGSGAQACCR
jgi:hypothetical protein